MEIRRYNPGEEPVVWKVFFEATHQSNARDYHADLIERWAPHNQDASQWADRLARKNPFVAVVDGEIVGMAEIESDGFIDYFYVHPNWQNKGIGKALLATLEAEASKLAVRVLSADVSITAKPFFLSRGFRVTETKSNTILGHPAPNFRMQKTLSSGAEGAVSLQTKRLKLVPYTPENIRARLSSMSDWERAAVSPEWLAQVVTLTEANPWLHGFAVVHLDTDATIGSCGFKGPPTPEGMVELGYGIEPAHQGKGYATEAATLLVEFAFADERVRVVRAHTLLDGTASIRVLTKCGFEPLGEVIEPVDGRLLRWEKRKEHA